MPYLACSFGKDSSVMLHLVRSFRPDVPVLFFTRKETFLIDNYQDVIDAWEHINLTQVLFKGSSLEMVSKSVIKNTASQVEAQFDSYFVGLRKDEAVGRRITLRKHGKFYKKVNGLTRIAPLADWTTKEIAAYMAEHQLPLLNKYKAEGMQARTTAGISSKFPHECLQSLKSRDIAAFNKLKELYPNINEYV